MTQTATTTAPPAPAPTLTDLVQSLAAQRDKLDKALQAIQALQADTVVIPAGGSATPLPPLAPAAKAVLKRVGRPLTAREITAELVKDLPTVRPGIVGASLWRAMTLEHDPEIKHEGSCWAVVQ